MSLHHSAEIHELLLARLEQVTGRQLPEWLECVDSGPALRRPEERAQWLRLEYGLPHGYARAIVQEHGRRRVDARR